MTHKKLMDNKAIRIINRIDIFILLVLSIALGLLIFSNSKANIQTDSIDYYAILQKLTDNDENPIVRNLYVVEQRSPGYSIFSIIPYYFASYVIQPFVKTEELVDSVGEGSFEKETEKMLIPSRPLLSRDIFFKNFYVEREKSWFEWKIIFALLFTSYLFLVMGVFFVLKTLSLENKKVIGVSLIMFVIFTSRIFMHNIIISPAYATLTAFGISSVFCYFFVKSFIKKDAKYEFFSGFFLGLLVLTRLETALLFFVSAFFLIFYKETPFLKRFLIGFSIGMLILLPYNFLQFGNAFHHGILKGDLNLISLDMDYVYANILNPFSGIIFWSPLISLGIVGLFFSNKKYSRILGVCSIVLMGLYLVKVPAMYQCVGQDSLSVGGLLMDCPRDKTEALTLVRYDINRYITVLIPFAVVGLYNLIMFLLKQPIKTSMNEPLPSLTEHL